MWSVDFTVSRNQPPAFKAYISPLDGHILHQMSGIVCTSMAILLLTGFLIWYLLHKVGKLRTIEQMKDDFTHNMTHELKTPVAVAYAGRKLEPCIDLHTRRLITNSLTNSIDI